MFVDEGDRVVLRGELGDNVVLDVTWSETPGIAEFSAQFDIDAHEYLADDDTYQGVNVLRIITRKSDGAKFGFKYWVPGNEGWDTIYEPNGEECGIEYEFDANYEVVGGEAYVFLPVKPATIPTYAFTE